MVSVETLGLLVIAGVASFLTAWTIGAGSSGATPFAPAVGANAISMMQAAFVVGIFGFLGAVLQGANVTETVGGELVGGVTLGPPGATVALLTAAGLIAVGVFTGYPIATAFVVSGAVVGVGLALGGEPSVAAWTEIVLFWAITPVVGTAVAYGTARLLRADGVPERWTVPALAVTVTAVVANVGFLVLGPPGEAGSVAGVVAGVLAPVVPRTAGRLGTTVVVAVVVGYVVYRRTVTDRVRAQRQLLLALGALVAFSAGGGKVGLAVGPLLPLVGALTAETPVIPVLVFGGVGLLAGSWMASTRMIKSLSQDYSELGPRRAIAVLVPSFLLAQAGIFLGVPMSFNEVFISAITGSGLAAGRETVSRSKLAYTAFAWISSLFLGAAISYGGRVAVATVA